jgi:hypothetical protein
VLLLGLRDYGRIHCSHWNNLICHCSLQASCSLATLVKVLNKCASFCIWQIIFLKENTLQSQNKQSPYTAWLKTFVSCGHVIKYSSTHQRCKSPQTISVRLFNVKSRSVSSSQCPLLRNLHSFFPLLRSVKNKKRIHKGQPNISKNFFIIRRHPVTFFEFSKPYEFVCCTQ